MEISGPRIGLRAMQLETVLAHVSQQLITCGRGREHLTVRPEVGAVCEKDACPDLCGGREVTCVPTATAWHKLVTSTASWRAFAHASLHNVYSGRVGNARTNDRNRNGALRMRAMPTLREPKQPLRIAMADFLLVRLRQADGVEHLDGVA